MNDEPGKALALYLARLLGRSELDEADRNAILGLPGEIQRINVQRDFVTVGEHVTSACLLIDGLVRRFAELKDGKRGIVALHVPGDMADLHSVVAPKVSWALQAMTPSTVLRVPHQALRRLAQGSPAVATAFWRDCVVDANLLAHWTINISRKDAVARVAHLLCEMAMRYRAIGRGTARRFPFPITQIHLADVVGLTAVHMNRVLRRLKDEGLVDKRGGDIEIHDFDQLAELADFDASYLMLGEKPDEHAPTVS